MQLVVLGMHRSGTSGVTRLLNLAGAWFGPDGIATDANEENPRGFWERRDVREVCDGLLHSGGFDWWKLSGFHPDAIPAAGRQRWLLRFEEILAELEQHRPWVVKEPRLCVLFPLVRPLLDAPVCVHVTREPLEVAESVHRRNGFSVPAALALWELYTVRSFEASAGLPRVLVRYQDLMADPVATTARLLDDLAAVGVTGLHPVPDEVVHGFISADLHRQHEDPSSRRGRLNAQQAALAARVDDGSILDGLEGTVSPGALEALEALERTEDQAERLEELGRQLEDLDRRLDDLARRLDEETRHRHAVEADREAALAERDALGAMAEEALATLEVQLDRFDRSRVGRLARSAMSARQAVTPGVARTDQLLLDGPRATLAASRKAIVARAGRELPASGADGER